MTLVATGETCASRTLALGFFFILFCLTQLIDVNKLHDSYLLRSGEKMFSSPASALGRQFSVDTPTDVAVTGTFDIFVEDTEHLDSPTSVLTPDQTANDLLVFPYPKIVRVGRGRRQRKQSQRKQVADEMSYLLSVAKSLSVQIDVDMDEDGYDDNDTFGINAVSLIRSSVIRMSKQLQHRVWNAPINSSVMHVQNFYVLLSSSP